MKWFSLKLNSLTSFVSILLAGPLRMSANRDDDDTWGDHEKVVRPRSMPSSFCCTVHRGLQFSVLAMIVLLIASTLSASPTGSIAGSVKDPTGAVISGAKLMLTNLATNAKMEAVSDTNGGFQFLQLAPAEYSLVVESQGFKKVTEKRILVQVDQITHVDVALEIGSVTQVVEVTSAAIPLLETDRSTLRRRGEGLRPVAVRIVNDPGSSFRFQSDGVRGPHRAHAAEVQLLGPR